MHSELNTSIAFHQLAAVRFCLRITGLPTKDETSETGECRKIYIGNSALLGDKVFFKRVNPIQLDLLTQAKNYHFRGITVFSNQTELR